MDAWSTHIPMIGSIFVKSTGPILEMGCGYYSTYMLHEMCKHGKRKLVSLEEKLDWVKKFMFLNNEFHLVQHVKDWSSFSLIDEFKWGMVLVDHAPGERRKFDIERLKDKADYLIVHDSQEAGYKYETVLPSFKYRFDYKLLSTWTTVVSNIHNLEFLNE